MNNKYIFMGLGMMGLLGNKISSRYFNAKNRSIPKSNIDNQKIDDDDNLFIPFLTDDRDQLDKEISSVISSIKNLSDSFDEESMRATIEIIDELDIDKSYKTVLKFNTAILFVMQNKRRRRFA